MLSLLPRVSIDGNDLTTDSYVGNVIVVDNSFQQVDLRQGIS